MTKTLAQRARAEAVQAEKDKKQAALDAKKKQKQLTAERPQMARDQVDEVWPEIEELILKAGREKKNTLDFYRGRTGYWTYDSGKVPDADTMAILKEIKKRATGITVSIDTHEIPGCDPDSGGLDGPQGPTWTTYSHHLIFKW